MQEPDTVGRWSYLCTQFNVLVIYIRLLFLPIGQNLDYLYHFKTGFFDGYTLLAFLFLAGLAGLGIWNRKKQPVITFGIFWFFITLSVESSIFPIRDALFEHRLYLPMFGFALIVSYLLFSFFSKKRLWAIIISLSIIISLGTATYLRNRIWQDGLTLWRDVLAKNPENLRGHNNVGVALMDKGRFKEAFGYFSGVLRAEPENANAHYNSGVALEKQGHLDEAIRHYSEALRIRPGYAKAHYNSGVVLARKGDLDQAIRHYTKALRIMPDYVEARVNLGVVLARKGDLDQAISHLSKALQIDPESAKAHNNLGGALAGQGRLDEAIHHYTEAVRIKPRYADAHYNLGIALASKGDLDRAIRHLSEALQIMPGHSKAHYDLGNLLASQGDLDGAIRHLSEVVRLSPDDNIPVCYNIACAYARQNKIEESIVWLKKAVDKGFKRWELLKTDKDMENIRGSSYYKEIIEGLRD
jgi:tetratricopeptide (TPR) repeat protein